MAGLDLSMREVPLRFPKRVEVPHAAESDALV